MAIKDSQFHKTINGWYNRSCQRWNRSLTDGNVADWINNPLGKVGGVAADAIREVTNVNTYTEGTQLEGLSFMNLNKLWRAKLAINRSKSIMEKDSYEFMAVQKGNDSVNEHLTTTPSIAQTQYESYGNRPPSLPVVLRNKISKGESISSEDDTLNPLDSKEYKEGDYSSRQSLYDAKKYNRKNTIIIVSPFTSPYQSIELQCRPDEIQVTPQSNWSAVPSMGRNNPFRMYTGGDDTIQFDISWFCNDPNNRGEVVTKCRLLESWSKSNGYSSAPPVLQIIWGDSDLYKDDFFILESASYKLTNFQDYALNHDDIKPNVTDSIINLKLYPNYATQTLTFKRVSTDNRTWENIVSIEELQKTNGILIGN